MVLGATKPSDCLLMCFVMHWFGISNLFPVFVHVNFRHIIPGELRGDLFGFQFVFLRCDSFEFHRVCQFPGKLLVS